MGNTCKPMAVSFKCMTKSTTNKKKKENKKKIKYLIQKGEVNEENSVEVDDETEFYCKQQIDKQK